MEAVKDGIAAATCAQEIRVILSEYQPSAQQAYNLDLLKEVAMLIVKELAMPSLGGNEKRKVMLVKCNTKLLADATVGRPDNVLRFIEEYLPPVQASYWPLDAHGLDGEALKFEWSKFSQ